MEPEDKITEFPITPEQEPEKQHSGSNILFFFFVFSILIHLFLLLLFFRCGFGPVGINPVDRMKNVFMALSPQEREAYAKKRRERQEDLIKRLRENAPQRNKERRIARLRAPKSSFGWVLFDNEPQVKKINDLIIPTDLFGDVGKAKSALATELEPQVSKDKRVSVQKQHQEQQAQALAKLLVPQKVVIKKRVPKIKLLKKGTETVHKEKYEQEKPQELQKEREKEKPKEEREIKREEKPQNVPIKQTQEPEKLSPTAFIKTREKKPEVIEKAREKNELVIQKEMPEEKPHEQVTVDHDAIERDLVEELKNTPEQDVSDFVSDQVPQANSENIAQNGFTSTSCGSSINFEPVSAQDQSGSSIGNVHVRGARRADGKEQKRNMFALMKGFIEKKIGEEGNDLIDQDGDPDIKPTFDEMRFISYQSKITHALQSSWKLNFERYPTQTNLHLPARGCVEFTIAKDGHLVQCKLAESSGQPELDKMLVKHFEYASPFPPIPDHLRVDSITQRMNIMVSPESIRF